MDNKLIQQYGEDILCYRIRTVRQKNRLRYKDFDRQLLELHREQKELCLQKENLGWEPLTPPIQRGWKRFFVLREDVAKNRDAPFFENILAKINTTDWSHRRDFVVRRRRFGKKIYVVKGQKLLQPREYYFFKLNFSEMEKRLFDVEYVSEGPRQDPVKKYVFKEPWRFVLRIRPNLISKVRVRDEYLEARLKRIDNYLKRNDYEKRQIKLLRGYGKWRYWKKGEKDKEKDPLKGWAVHEIINQAKENSW